MQQIPSPWLKIVSTMLMGTATKSAAPMTKRFQHLRRWANFPGLPVLSAPDFVVGLFAKRDRVPDRHAVRDRLPPGTLM